MYCSECGKPARGKFCCHCGTPLSAPAAVDEPPVESVVVIDWDREVRYETLMRDPQVRQVIEDHARLAPQRMSTEQFLALADKLVPQPVSMEVIAVIAQPLWSKLGVRTGKAVAGEVPASIARVIVRALCSLARNGQPLQGVSQGDNGCSLEAELPSDLRSMAGKLSVSLWRSPRGTGVAANTRIDGQLMDWGKSRGCLERLLSDLRHTDPLRVAA